MTKFAIVDMGNAPWSLSGTGYLKYNGRTIATCVAKPGNDATELVVEHAESIIDDATKQVDRLCALKIAELFSASSNNAAMIKFDLYRQEKHSANSNDLALARIGLLNALGAVNVLAVPNPAWKGRSIVSGDWPKLAWNLAAVAPLEIAVEAIL